MNPKHSPFVIALGACLSLMAPLLQPLYAQTDLYYASTSNDVDSISIPGLAAGPSFAGNLFSGAAVGAARNIQIDPGARLLWYANTGGDIDSINMTNSTAGPLLATNLFQGANSGAGRHFSIDPLRKLLYYSVTDGSIQVVNLNNGQTVRTLLSNLFRGANPGGFRHTSIDYVNNLLFYAVSDNSIVSFSLKDTTLSGPTIPGNRLLGAAVGASRHFVYNPNTRLLHYVTTGGNFESINPFTLATGPTVTGNLLTGAASGAGRPITVDAPMLPADTTAPRASVRGGRKIVTQAPRVTLRGRASDPNGIRQVTVAVGRARPVVAKGTTNWRFNLNFKRVKRLSVKITVTDFAANRKTLRLIAIRKP